MGETYASVDQHGERKLSLCMIVRDEGAVIRRCLESAKHIVDEIIVVDTGSTDDTMDVCRSFGAHVFEYPWSNDFAAARNYGLVRATGDWILWMDADEVLDASDCQQLTFAMQSENVDVYSLQLINYCTDEPSPYEAFQIAHCRLFRNHKGILFENKIHEYLNVGDSQPIVTLPIRIYHFGYMPSIVKGKDKHTRNVQLLENELRVEGYSPWIHYHLASEYFNVDNYDLALKHLDYGILRFILSGLKPPSLCYRLKYTILLQTNRIDQALQTIDKAIAIYPDYVDLIFIKGLLLIEEKSYPQAIEAFHTCTSLGEENWDYLTLRGVGSFRAWYYCGVCLESMSDFPEAVGAYERSLASYADFRPAREALAALRDGG